MPNNPKGGHSTAAKDAREEGLWQFAKLAICDLHLLLNSHCCEWRSRCAGTPPSMQMRKHSSTYTLHHIKQISCLWRYAGSIFFWTSRGRSAIVPIAKSTSQRSVWPTSGIKWYLCKAFDTQIDILKITLAPECLTDI